MAAPSMASMLVDIGPLMLTGRQESERVGRHESVISRARKNDPTHPVASDPRTCTVMVGGRGSVLAHADAIDAYWAAREANAKPTPKPPPGLTRTQWAALQALAAGGTVSPVTRRRLTAAGYLTHDGKLTDLALAVLNPEPQEQQ